MELHVTLGSDHKWEIREGKKGKKVISEHVRKRDAEITARRLLRETGGGELFIHRLGGEIEARYQVPAPSRAAA